MLKLVITNYAVFIFNIHLLSQVITFLLREYCGGILLVSVMVGNVGLNDLVEFVAVHMEKTGKVCLAERRYLLRHGVTETHYPALCLGRPASLGLNLTQVFG